MYNNSDGRDPAAASGPSPQHQSHLHNIYSKVELENMRGCCYACVHAELEQLATGLTWNQKVLQRKLGSAGQEEEAGGGSLCH